MNSKEYLKLLLAFLIGFMVNQMFGYNIVEGQDNQQDYPINTRAERCSGGNRRLNLLLSGGHTKGIKRKSGSKLLFTFPTRLRF